MPLPPPFCGLIVFGFNLPVPLKGISVDVQVKGFVADVSATLKYKNEEEKAVEAIFVFPMDEDSAVYSFEAKVEGKTIVADLQEKKQAHRTYNEAISRGQQAFLLEEDKSSADVFSCNVGNLPPGQEAEVTLKYVRELPVEADGAIRFVLPAVLNPRYTPKDQPVSVTAIRPQVPIGEIPYALSLSAHFQSAFGIVKIVSNCDISPVEYTNEDKTAAKVSLAEGHKFERDVELLAYYSEVNKPSVTVEADAAKEPKSSVSHKLWTLVKQKFSSKPHIRLGSLMTDSVAMLNFYPSFPAVQEQTNYEEFIFVVDQSGSMECAMNSERNAPQRIDSAKETLVLLLKSLPLGCYFNIFGFGSHFESFFTESKEYTQQSMEEAVKKVQEIKANFGGTEILRPLKKIYDTAGRPDHPRQLFLFTDGEVGNTKEVIDEVQKNVNNHRCFAFGIGEGASTSLIKGVARAGGGTFEFITGKDRMQTKVLRALKCPLQPTVKNVSLTWSLPSGLEAILLSKVPTAIFQGQRSIVYAQLKGKVETEAEGEVCLQYNFKDELLKNTIRFPLKVEKAERPTIHRLAAKSLISELQCEKDSRSEDGKKRILEVSLESGVISSLTAFVAVNKDTKTPVEGPPVRRDIPAPGFMHGVMYPSFDLSMPLMGSGGPLVMGYRSMSQRRANSGPVSEQCLGTYSRPVSDSRPMSARSACFDSGRVLECLGTKSIYVPECLGTKSIYVPECFGTESIYDTDSESGSIYGTDSGPVSEYIYGTKSIYVPDSESEECYGPKYIYGTAGVNTRGRQYPSLQQSCHVKPRPAFLSVATRGARTQTGKMPETLRWRSLASRPAETGEGARKSKYMDMLPPPAQVQKIPPFVSLISLQNADGSWNLTPEFCSILGISEQDIINKNPDQNMDSSVWATVLAVIWLHASCLDQREEWELLEGKAISWLKAKAGSSLDQVVRAGNDLLKSSLNPNVFGLREEE